MRRMELLLPRDHRASFDLETSVNEAATLNQRTLETYTRPFPKTPDRWLSHDEFRSPAKARSQTISIRWPCGRSRRDTAPSCRRARP
jgi:hypothetical protein